MEEPLRRHWPAARSGRAGARRDRPKYGYRVTVQNRVGTPSIRQLDSAARVVDLEVQPFELDRPSTPPSCFG